MVDGEPCTKMTMQGENTKRKMRYCGMEKKTETKTTSIRIFMQFLYVIWRKTRLLWYGDSSKVYFMWSQGMKKGWKREAEIRFYGHRKKILCDLFIWGPAYEKWQWRWWRWKKFFIADALLPTDTRSFVHVFILYWMNRESGIVEEWVRVRGFIIFFLF